MTWEGGHSVHRIPSIDWWLIVTYSTICQAERWTSYCNRNVCRFSIVSCSLCQVAWVIVSLDRWKETTASLSYLIFLLWLHVGFSWFHIPEVWQVLESDPDLEYLWSHEKDATVSTGYSASVTLLYCNPPAHLLVDSEENRWLV